MGDAMVTGRMPVEKKKTGAAVLAKAGLNVSQAINLLFDKLIHDQNVDFLDVPTAAPTAEQWAASAAFIDSLSTNYDGRFDNLSKAELRALRFKTRGLA